MRLVLIVSISILFLTLSACSGGGGASVTAPQEGQDTVLDVADDNSSGNQNGGGTSTPTTPVTPNPPVSANPPPNPIAAPPVSQGTPGEIVDASQGQGSQQYDEPRAELASGRNPIVEPNSDRIQPIIVLENYPDTYIPASSGSFEIQVADNVNGSGVKELNCTFNNVALKGCSPALTVDGLQEGLQVLTATAVDYDGNESGQVSYSFFVDATAPTVALTQTPPSSTQDRTARLEFTGQDAGSGISHYECRLSDQAYVPCISGHSITDLPDGVYQGDVVAIDRVGRRSPPAQVSWAVDNQGPQITFVEVPSDTVTLGVDPQTALFEVDDAFTPQGITVSCQLNGQTVNCSDRQSFSVEVVGAGNVQLIVTAQDSLGNESQSIRIWTTKLPAIDKTLNKTVDPDRPVDILFVVDNSGSMEFERSSLADRIDGMIEKLDGLDWQIAVTSTDATSTNAYSDGNLIELIGMPGEYVLDSSMDVDTAQNVFGQTVQDFPDGSPNEEGMYVSARMIERHLAGQQEHVEFLRQGADLSIVVLSDEDENSDGATVRITPEQLVDFVSDSFNGQKRMVFHSIIAKPGDSVCLAGEGYNYGDEYDALSRLTGFGELGGAIIGSVCELDYTAQLADIGQSVKDLQNSMTLDCPPFDANDDGNPDLKIYYRADSGGTFTELAASFQYQNNRLVFDELLQPGDYKVDYKCEAP